MNSKVISLVKITFQEEIISMKYDNKSHVKVRDLSDEFKTKVYPASFGESGM